MNPLSCPLHSTLAAFDLNASSADIAVPAHPTALPRRARFTVNKWLQSNGEEVTLADAARRPGWSCRDKRCDASVKGKLIAYVSKAEGLPLDCIGIAILIADFPLRGACGQVPTRIDRFDLWRCGITLKLFA